MSAICGSESLEYIGIADGNVSNDNRNIKSNDNSNDNINVDSSDNINAHGNADGNDNSNADDNTNSMVAMPLLAKWKYQVM